MLLAVIALSAAFGGWAGSSVPRVNELLGGIFDDVGSIARSFSGGPDDPNGPVVSARTRNQDAQLLESATDKANRLASEIEHVRDER